MSMVVVGQDSLIHQALNLLMNESATSIAILGPGGIGKTTLMKQLYSKLISTHHFDTVIWITVSSRFTFQKVQDAISKSIGLFDSNCVGKSPEEKSRLIRTKINCRKSLLFLDDLWFDADLKSLGVEGSKFIYSTRLAEVAQHMGAHTVFKLKVLSNEHAWKLFRVKVGNDEILKNVMVQRIARVLVSKCKGLPILISTLGSAMSRRKTREEWESAARQIKMQLNNYDEVTTIFKFCYDSLPNSHNIRSCLSYFSLFPEDFTILKNDLIDFWICDNIIGGYRSIRDDPLGLGYDVMHTLIRAGFLEEEGIHCVKLLDMIRDFARARATESLVFHSTQLLEKPLPANHKMTRHKVETIGWISSMEDSIRKNKPAGVTKNLFTFLLSYNPFIMIKRRNSFPLLIKKLLAFADSYNPLVLFRPIPSSYLYKLTVLDLSNSGIEVAPRQISNLISLQYLNLSHTWIDRLPIELKTLTKLKCLNLEHDDQLRMIPKKLISSLSSLRILKMFRCGFSVEEEARNMLSLRNMDINPILSLKQLKVLSITIASISALHTYFRNFKLLDCTESLSLEVFGVQSRLILPL